MDMIEGKADVDRRKLPQDFRARQNHRRGRRSAFQPASGAVLRLHRLGCWASGGRIGHDDGDRLRGAAIRPAAKAGLQAGDKILEVDGKPVTRFFGMNDSVIWNVVRSEGAGHSVQGRARRQGS